MNDSCYSIIISLFYCLEWSGRHSAISIICIQSRHSRQFTINVNILNVIQWMTNKPPGYFDTTHSTCSTRRSIWLMVSLSSSLYTFIRTSQYRMAQPKQLPTAIVANNLRCAFVCVFFFVAMWYRKRYDHGIDLQMNNMLSSISTMRISILSTRSSRPRNKKNNGHNRTILRSCKRDKTDATRLCCFAWLSPE